MQIKRNVLLYLHVKYNQLKQIYTETLDEKNNLHSKQLDMCEVLRPLTINL